MWSDNDQAAAGRAFLKLQQQQLVLVLAQAAALLLLYCFLFFFISVNAEASVSSVITASNININGAGTDDHHVHHHEDMDMHVEASTPYDLSTTSTTSSTHDTSSIMSSKSRTLSSWQPWMGPVGSRVITVDKVKGASGGGDFMSIQAAVDSVKENNRESVTIHISQGYYVEKVVVPRSKPFITFQGKGRDVTMIEWHDRAGDRGPSGQQLHTYNTASVTVFADYFSARNISFKNTAPAPMPGMEGWQAAAFRISGDKAYFSGCGFYGAQDTLCDDMGRHYFKECYIEGSIDFIFGNGRSIYKNCELHSIAKMFGSIAAQDRKSPEEKTGFAFINCTVTGTGPIYVGRAMGQYSRIIFAYTFFDDIVAEEGWDNWDKKINKEKTVFFGLYKCYGPGAAAVRGVSWAQELDFETAHPFIAKSFVNGRHWIRPEDT